MQAFLLVPQAVCIHQSSAFTLQIMRHHEQHEYRPSRVLQHALATVHRRCLTGQLQVADKPKAAVIRL